jgi:hypothetical protein
MSLLSVDPVTLLGAVRHSVVYDDAAKLFVARGTEILNFWAGLRSQQLTTLPG